MGELRRLTPGDLPRLRAFWLEHWAGDEIIAHGEIFRPDQMEGFVAGDWSGVVTYCLRDKECEIVSLDSLQEGRGTGSALIQAVIHEAHTHGCTRLVLTTTNDNLRALGFYQKRGFALLKVLPRAVDETRKVKPRIPMIGAHGIPLRDEIELEMKL